MPKRIACRDGRSNVDLMILVVDCIETGPDHISAELRIGDRHERIQLGLAIPGLLAFEYMPTILDCNTFARNAVISLMTRAHRGDNVSLSADLSDIVRQANEPWPLPAPREKPSDSAASASTSIEVTRTVRDAPEHGLTTVHLLVGGAPAIVIVDLREGPNHPVRFRFVEGAHPWQMTPAASQAMLKALWDAAHQP